MRELCLPNPPTTQLPETTLRFKAICLQILRTTDGDAKKSILTRLEMLDVDYQLIDTEEKRKKIIQKLLTKEILSIDTETTGTEPMEAELWE